MRFVHVQVKPGSQSVRGVVGHNSHLEQKSAENALSFSLFSLSSSPFSTALLRLEKVLRGLNI